MPLLQPKMVEVFYLRMLLSYVESPKSFEELFWVDGVRCEDEDGNGSYLLACKARGLLLSDDEWHLTMAEIATEKGGATMRDVFVTLLLHCEVKILKHCLINIVIK